MIYLKMPDSKLKCGLSDSLIINCFIHLCKSSALEADGAHANGLILKACITY